MLGGSLSVLVAAPSWAACSVFASTPFDGGYYVSGSGGKRDCGSTNYVRVRLRWDRPFSPDPTLDDRQGQYRNVRLTVSSDCLAGKHAYYVDTDGDSGSATSDPRRTVTC